ncbi:pentapeptide repeat-containing protein [Caballeronia sp. LZ032]|uniref:pentapeptide repeat-containing protein n=1 Tax=Caballeronia sp. LZ032 TaxID=3038565 RepID=UPI00285AC1A9|nr:pentapeptide repeat-containing protein [Caballeronia sp. LZ032]MDR5878805.1 pentapeptide repeat-containing protein [Caballeronia sp. LZ032]
MRLLIRPFFSWLRLRLTAFTSFRWFVDVTTLLASVATVVTLLILIHDRREQANIAAWTLLQAYLQGKPRANFDQGQGFALEKLAEHRVVLTALDANDATIRGAHLHGLIAPLASFRRSELTDVDLSGANFEDADFSCVLMRGGSYRGARFDGADISTLKVWWFPATDIASAMPPPELDIDAFRSACYEPGYPPDLPPGLTVPSAPQGQWCTNLWGKQWKKRVGERQTKAVIEPTSGEDGRDDCL